MTQEKKKFTCKDCLHYEACKGIYVSNSDYAILEDFDKEHYADILNCEDFSDKSEWLHLPCKAGDTVYLPWEWDGTSGIARLITLQVVLTGCESYIDTNLKSDDYDYLTKYNYGRFRFEDFGSKVFRTEEEAKKALAERRTKC